MTDQDEILTIRSSAMATVFLTRHPDVSIRTTSLQDRSFKDVFLRDKKGKPDRRFRVYFLGQLTVADAAEAATVASEKFEELRDAGSQIYPVLLAVFSNTDDRGWVTWVTKPGRHDYDPGILTPLPEPDFCEFDRKALDDIVRTVREWQPTVQAAL